MGLDAVEIILEIEKSFGITISDDDVPRVRSVGDLHSLILEKLQPARSEACLTSHCFYRLRAALGELFGHERRRVVPDAEMEDLIPRERRRRAWKSLLRCSGHWR